MKKVKFLLLVIFIFSVPVYFYGQASAQIKSLNLSKNILDSMVLIPSGEFKMGSIRSFENEYPVHNVFVDSFYMDKFLVTNADFKVFCDSTKKPYPANPNWDTAYFLKRTEYPVINVDWESAAAFAAWAGKRLPTEAEWECAAKGGKDSPYINGDTITHDDANFSGVSGRDKWRHTSPVDAFAPNPFGIYDLAGNVWQWCSDFYLNFYYVLEKNSNPTGPASGTEKVIRGGSWDSSPEYLRVSVRGKNKIKLKNSNVGFRCVISVSDVKKN